MKLSTSQSLLSLIAFTCSSLTAAGYSAEATASEVEPVAISPSALPSAVVLPGDFTIDCVPNVPSAERLHVVVSPIQGTLSFKRSGKHPSAGFMANTSSTLKIGAFNGAPGTRTFGMNNWSLAAEGDFTDLATGKPVGFHSLQVELTSNSISKDKSHYDLSYFSGFEGGFDVVEKDALVVCTLK